MLNPSDTWPLATLASKANITERTIRFYQSEGLLDAPGVRGRTATYGQPDLDRLRLIKTLQEDRLALHEIRDLIQILDDDGVRRELASKAASRRSAADYARSVRLAADRASDAATRAAPRVPHGPPGPRRQWGSGWDRITLTPGIELHVRQGLSHRKLKLVARLLDVATATPNDKWEKEP